MTTTPLLPLPEAYDIDDQERRFWYEQILARDAQWQAYATQARADLEAENADLRRKLEEARALLQGIIETAADMARAALENTHD